MSIQWNAGYYAFYFENILVIECKLMLSPISIQDANVTIL